MESFFLAETLKYLYLIFDTENFLHNDISSSSFKVIQNTMGSEQIKNFNIRKNIYSNFLLEISSVFPKISNFILDSN